MSSKRRKKSPRRSRSWRSSPKSGASGTKRSCAATLRVSHQQGPYPCKSLMELGSYEEKQQRRFPARELVGGKN